MFYLRTIDENGVQFNTTIGEEYELIHRYESPEEFRETFGEYFGYPHVADEDDNANFFTREIYAFLSNDGRKWPLFKDKKVYIMTAGGSTFSNISY